MELDGGYHDYQDEADFKRQAYLEAEVWRVIRFRNEDVLEDVEAVTLSIARQIDVEPIFRSPSR